MCVQHGLKCNVEGIPIRNWEMLELEKEQLKSEQQIVLQTIVATLAWLAQLEKQQEFLCCCAGKMLRRGLKTLNELDAQEEKERLEQETKEKEEALAQI